MSRKYFKKWWKCLVNPVFNNILNLFFKCYFVNLFCNRKIHTFSMNIYMLKIKDTYSHNVRNLIFKIAKFEWKQGKMLQVQSIVYRHVVLAVTTIRNSVYEKHIAVNALRKWYTYILLRNCKVVTNLRNILSDISWPDSCFTMLSNFISKLSIS